MVKGIFSRVAWVGRATVFCVGLAVILALVLGVASTALGSNGQAFLLGRSNTASAVSSLIMSGVGPALDLKVDSGPPLAVNSSAKVNNLNADQVDGKSDTDFYAAGSKVADSDKLDGKNANDLTRVAQMVPDPPYYLTLSGGGHRYGQPLSVEAPAAGFVRLSGTMSASGPQGSMFSGYIRHIQTGHPSMPAATGFAAGDNGNSWGHGNIALDAVFPVDQGTNTFEFLVYGVPTDFNGVQVYPTINSGQLTAEYTPYGPTGADTLGTTANQEPISAQQLEEMNP